MITLGILIFLVGFIGKLSSEDNSSNEKLSRNVMRIGGIVMLIPIVLFLLFLLFLIVCLFLCRSLDVIITDLEKKIRKSLNPQNKDKILFLDKKYSNAIVGMDTKNEVIVYSYKK